MKRQRLISADSDTLQTFSWFIPDDVRAVIFEPSSLKVKLFDISHKAVLTIAVKDVKDGQALAEHVVEVINNYCQDDPYR